MNEPVLARRTISYYDKPHNLIVHGGLHYIRGNSKPYFSLGAEIWNPRRKDDCKACGCLHEEILKHYPQFSDLAAMHLSDIDGVPMHAEANSWYDLAGALLDHAGEQYHVGNSPQHFPKPEDAPRKGEWDKTDYRNPMPDEALEIFAKHVRVDLETARTLRDRINGVFIENWNHELTRPAEEQRARKYCWQVARAWFGEWIRAQYPRWKQEALECIAKHGLKVYGDAWEQAL